MTTKTENQEIPENEYRLLSSEERAIFGLVATKEPPHSWRAQALLAIDEGATQAEAGRQSGLTKGQVRYWLGKFRKNQTSIFPEELMNQAQQEQASSPQSPAEPITLPDMPDLEQDAGEEEAQPELLIAEETAGQVHEAAAQQENAPKAKKKPKKKAKKKSKKASKSKKVKKTKQDKKAKKGKKSKKNIKKKGSKKVKGAKGKSSKKTKKKSKK